MIQKLKIENNKKNNCDASLTIRTGVKGWFIKRNFKERKCLNYLHYYIQGDLSLSYDYNINMIHMIVQCFLLQISKKNIYDSKFLYTFTLEP